MAATDFLQEGTVEGRRGGTHGERSKCFQRSAVVSHSSFDYVSAAEDLEQQ